MCCRMTCYPLEMGCAAWRHTAGDALLCADAGAASGPLWWGTFTNERYSHQSDIHTLIVFGIVATWTWDNMSISIVSLSHAWGLPFSRYHWSGSKAYLSVGHVLLELGPQINQTAGELDPFTSNDLKVSWDISHSLSDCIWKCVIPLMNGNFHFTGETWW